MVGSSAVYCALQFLAAQLMGPAHLHSCAAGFSCVLFGLKVNTSYAVTIHLFQRDCTLFKLKLGPFSGHPAEQLAALAPSVRSSDTHGVLV